VLDLRNGEEGAPQVIENLSQATAVFCANDISALGVMQGLKKAGLSIPGDVQVIGYDDVSFAERTTPPLTTIQQPKHEMGRLAAELLVQEMLDPDNHIHQSIVLEPALVVRQSAG
jgi:LacI family transcriptional regulator